MLWNNKLKRGCGIGCGLIFFCCMVIFGGVAYYSKQMGKSYKVVKELEQQLVENLGTSDQLPAGYSGLPTADRLEVFLTVREQSAEWRHQVETSFLELLADDVPSEEQGFRHFLKIVKATSDLAPVFSGFWTARNQAMLSGGMGMGEYIYLYCLSYNSWLGYDPSDGARDAGTFLSGLGASGPLAQLEDNEQTGDQGEAHRRQWARKQINIIMLKLLQRAQQEVSASEDPALQAWAQELQQEILLIQDDTLRIPFSDNLPPAITRQLEPFGSRLEATYSIAINPIELIFEDTWEEDRP